MGFVVQGERTRAALVVDGETFLLAPGDEAAGYALLSADDSGVRLRTPSGAELTLSVPE